MQGPTLEDRVSPHFSSFHRLLERGNRRQTLVDRLMRYVSMLFREALAE